MLAVTRELPRSARRRCVRVCPNARYLKLTYGIVRVEPLVVIVVVLEVIRLLINQMIPQTEAR